MVMMVVVTTFIVRRIAAVRAIRVRARAASRVMLLVFLFLLFLPFRLGVLLGGILEERSCYGTTDTADDAVTAHLVATKRACCTASHGSEKATIAFGGIRPGARWVSTAGRRIAAVGLVAIGIIAVLLTVWWVALLLRRTAVSGLITTVLLMLLSIWLGRLALTVGIVLLLAVLIMRLVVGVAVV
jgi:hypothetical protein